MLKELNPFQDDFWQRLGKFFKRLGPVVPIASWGCYLIPGLSSGHSLLLFYAVFVCTTGYFCFLLPRSLQAKLDGLIYASGTRQNHQKQLTILIDALFMGIITFSLACLMSIMLFRVSAMPLYEIVYSSEPLNLPTSIISFLSLGITAIRYHQKRHALSFKMLAFQLRKSSVDERVAALNEHLSDIFLLKHRLSRFLCDCLVVFYNIFFVGFSLAMVFFSAQLSLLFQGMFIWKMIGISSMVTARIAYANRKLSVDYFAHKLSNIAQVTWTSDHSIFSKCDMDSEDYSPGP